MPFFQIFLGAFLDAPSPNASICLMSPNETFAFAHEAPIRAPATDEVFLASGDGDKHRIIIMFHVYAAF